MRQHWKTTLAWLLPTAGLFALWAAWTPGPAVGVKEDRVRVFVGRPWIGRDLTAYAHSRHELLRGSAGEEPLQALIVLNRFALPEEVAPVLTEAGLKGEYLSLAVPGYHGRVDSAIAGKTVREAFDQAVTSVVATNSNQGGTARGARQAAQSGQYRLYAIRVSGSPAALLRAAAHPLVAVVDPYVSRKADALAWFGDRRISYIDLPLRPDDGLRLETLGR